MDRTLTGPTPNKDGTVDKTQPKHNWNWRLNTPGTYPTEHNQRSMSKGTQQMEHSQQSIACRFHTEWPIGLCIYRYNDRQILLLFKSIFNPAVDKRYSTFIMGFISQNQIVHWTHQNFSKVNSVLNSFKLMQDKFHPFFLESIYG